MSLTVVLLILLFGMLLFMLEVFIIPGTTVFGIIGILAIIAGVVASYIEFGPLVGSIVLVGSMGFCGFLTWIGIQQIGKGPIAVTEKIDGRVNNFDDFGLKAGDAGITLTDLRPEGKAVFGDTRVVVTAFSGFIDSDVEIEILKIQDNKIFVQIKTSVI